MIHHGPDLDVAELPQGLHSRVVTKMLATERRVARPRPAETKRKGKAVVTRFRKTRSDKNTTGQWKPYRLAKRMAERTQRFHSVSRILSSEHSPDMLVWLPV